MGLIQAQEVYKTFGQKVALDHVSLDIPKGKIFGLLGPNGAGKTTLIRIINRITIPTSGQVLFDGRPITQRDVEKIGYLPEERGLYRKMKVGEQAMYFARLKGMSRTDAQEELKKWFYRFDIMSWWNKKVEELSKGMAQKVQFITTVVHRPSLLILDEPFSGFDPVNAQVIRGEILRLKDEGSTIVLSTHNMQSVEELCDNIALINTSKLVITGGTDEIRRKYGNNNASLVYSAPEAVASVPGLFTVLSDTDEGGRHTAVLGLQNAQDSPKALKYLVDSGITIHTFEELMPRMNDIFIKLVTGKEAKHYKTEEEEI
ncbi:MAG: ABC transporter ATP-binding protein [Bacteroidales bacterium]|nr:ABC transporter ATP-binding protein [Bacteroidales bacterium]